MRGEAVGRCLTLRSSGTGRKRLRLRVMGRTVRRHRGVRCDQPLTLNVRAQYGTHYSAGALGILCVGFVSIPEYIGNGCICPAPVPKIMLCSTQSLRAEPVNQQPQGGFAAVGSQLAGRRVCVQFGRARRPARASNK